MSIKNWFRNKVAAMSIALSNVEKDFLGQDAKDLNQGTKQERRHQQGTLADSLMHGEITQEVKDARWRMYKVLKASQGIKLSFDKLDDDGDAYYLTQKNDGQRILNKVKVDEHDDYPLEMVVRNDEVTLANIEVLNDTLKEYDAPVVYTNEDGLEVASHGEINFKEFLINNKGEKPIQIARDIIPKFCIERFAIKLNVRIINESQRLLEFYVSKYPDEYNRTTRLFISEIKRLIANGPININLLEISEVGFITHQTLGAKDFLFYGYDNLTYDKTIEFDGYYVIKFKADVLVNGEDVLADFVENGLDEKYKNKEGR